MIAMPKLDRTEHVLSYEEAEKYLTHKINEDKAFADVAAKKIQEYNSEYLKHDTVAGDVLDGISGVSGEFSQYTSESIDRMTPEFFGKLIDYRHTEIQGVRDEMATATMAVAEDTMNGGIYTTDELLRSYEYASDNYQESIRYAFEAKTKSPEELKSILGEGFEPTTHETIYANDAQVENINNVHQVSGLTEDDLSDLVDMSNDLKL